MCWCLCLCVFVCVSGTGAVELKLLFHVTFLIVCFFKQHKNKNASERALFSLSSSSNFYAAAAGGGCSQLVSCLTDSLSLKKSFGMEKNRINYLSHLRSK